MIFQCHTARITPSAAVYGRVGCITLSLSTTCSLDVNWVSLSPPKTAFLNAGMSDFPASSQSGTGMNKDADAGTCLVPE
jgi:hypothetical protein